MTFMLRLLLLLLSGKVYGAEFYAQRLIDNIPNIPDMKRVGATAYFINSSSEAGSELWASDGTLQGTRLAVDLVPGPSNGAARMGIPFVNRVEFFATHGYLSEGYSDATQPLTSWGMPSTASINYVSARFGGKYLAQVFVLGKGSEPWITNGTPSGTFQLKEIDPRPDLSGMPSGYADDVSTLSFLVNGKMLFTGKDNDGFQLWRTDGTSSGTVRVSQTNQWYLRNPLVHQNRIYEVGYIGGFSAPFFCNPNTFKLFSSDGTTTGTQVYDLPLQEVSSSLTEWHHQLYATDKYLWIGLYLSKIDDDTAQIYNNLLRFDWSTHLFETLFSQNANMGAIKQTTNSHKIYINMSNRVGVMDDASNMITNVNPASEDGRIYDTYNDNIIFGKTSATPGKTDIYACKDTPSSGRFLLTTSSPPDSSVVFKGSYIFASATNGLYLSDGTQAGSKEMPGFPFANKVRGKLELFADKVMFTASTPQSETNSKYELWVTKPVVSNNAIKPWFSYVDNK